MAAAEGSNDMNQGSSGNGMEESGNDMEERLEQSRHTVVVSRGIEDERLKCYRADGQPKPD